MRLDEFNTLTEQGYTHIPVYRELVADLISPLYVFSGFYSQAHTVLFESAKSHETKGRFSIMGLPAARKYEFGDGEVKITDGAGVRTEAVANPYDYIDQLTRNFKSPKIDNLPQFLGGLVGYFSYDSFQFIEPKVHFPQSKIPYIALLQCDETIIFDNFKGTFFIVVNTTVQTEAGYLSALARIAEIEAAVFSARPAVSHHFAKKRANPEPESSVSEADFCAQVSDLQHQIRQGEIMQAVLSREVSFHGSYAPFTLYRALRLVNPSPYMYYINLGDFRIIGSSPEILVQAEDERLTIRPIAGTRRRGKNAAEDRANRDALLADPKERAEHMMLVDLARNDLSKVCRPGSVQVDEMMVVERYSHVMHLTSNVTGASKAGVTAIDALRAALPAGTLSGAPKIRAMQLLSALENRSRGVYGGAVGYLGYNGALDTAIVIRTAIHFDHHVSVGVGAGIVYDSEPAAEWAETDAKLAVFREVLQYQ